MTTNITNGIKIEVETQYVVLPMVQNSVNNDFVFTYTITITNTTEFTVQLKRRFWRIFDSDYSLRYAEGEGVIGVQPVIEPKDAFTYNSGCQLNSDMGYMQGYYTFTNLVTNEDFKVQIPRFELVVPEKLN
jgi:ApaG protein